MREAVGGAAEGGCGRIIYPRSGSQKRIVLTQGNTLFPENTMTESNSTLAKLMAEHEKERAELEARHVAKYVEIGLSETEAKERVASLSAKCRDLVDAQVKLLNLSEQGKVCVELIEEEEKRCWMCNDVCAAVCPTCEKAVCDDGMTCWCVCEEDEDGNVLTFAEELPEELPHNFAAEDVNGQEWVYNAYTGVWRKQVYSRFACLTCDREWWENEQGDVVKGKECSH